MIVETSKNLLFHPFYDKESYQREIIKILLDYESKDRWSIYFNGRTEDLKGATKASLFYKSEKVPRGSVKILFNVLMEFTDNPEYCIVIWRRVSKYCKHIPYKKKINKDGTFHKSPYRKKLSS